MGDEQVAILLERYMRAAVSLRVGRPVDAWPLDLVEDAYDLLPPQRVTFDEWAARRGFDVREAREHAENRRSLAILESLHGAAARDDSEGGPSDG